MTQSKDSAALPRWSLTAREKSRLDRKFRTSLLALLRAVEERLDRGEAASDLPLAELAATMTEAGEILDECAANCHALAATLKTFATNEEFMPGEALPKNRLAGAIGKTVILTRTTIDELQGQTLILEKVTEDNAIVRFQDEYWGTPVDRLFVIGPSADEPPGEEEADKDAEEHLAISISPKAAALMARIANGQIENPLFIWTGEHRGVVRVEYPLENLREFIPVKALPEHIARFVTAADSARPAEELNIGTAATPPPESNYAFVFKLKRGELGNAIQFLTMVGREGMLELTFPASQTRGTIHLGNGTVIKVQYLEADGVEALARMMVQEKLAAGFIAGEIPEPPILETSTDQLLIEAAVRADEIVDERSRKEHSGA